MRTGKAVLDVAIVGGGLAGLMAASRAERRGLSSALFDVAVPQTSGGLGGFAPFSGAKFSLFPAGTGLAPLVGGEDAIIAAYAGICEEFVGLGFREFDLDPGLISGRETEAGIDLAHRSYHSVVLTPARIRELLGAMSSRLTRTTIARTAVTRLRAEARGPHRIELADGTHIAARSIVMAAGRLGADLLADAQVPETPGKGIDVGIRLGFGSREALAGLRRLGPDAKFLSRGVRTFCLNSPGEIFHYPGVGFCLPGGVVAEPDQQEANVGILVRLPDRPGELRRLTAIAPKEANPLCFPARREIDWPAHARLVLGTDVCGRIDEFLRNLTLSGCLDLSSQFIVHYPLLDWHWPVFSLPGRLGTATPGVIAVGDASGHARGLLQAALTGSLSIEEVLP